MKKQFRLYVILTVLIVGTFAAMSKMLLPQANATYVEGYIQQDTVWTLTDSPFIVVKDVIIRPGYTLTVEPGVEVRFGGNFSLTVEGVLKAVGTQEDMIKFVSNREQPQPGDWNAIRFVNKFQASTIAYSIVRHATDGMIVENGNVQVSNCEISNNLESGVYLTGDNLGYVETSMIQLNKDGVFLNGNTTGMIIRQNSISANIDNGLHFQSVAGAYINSITVSSNTLSSNSRGIYAFGNVSASITHNSISFNDMGIFFENVTTAMSPEFNDIYGNISGMNVTTSLPTEAEYNYWGDETGAYHASLNPEGKGNPVQSNGDDLDFIPFLSAPNGHINVQPTAKLLSDKVLVQPNQPVIFIATNSSDDLRVDKYFFDFGDSRNTSWTTLSVFDHMYASVGTYQANVKVMDDFGAVSANTAVVTITVSVLTPIDVSTELSRSQIVSEGQVSVTVRATVGGSPVSSANIMMFSILGGTLTPQSGLTDSAGQFASTFTAPKVDEHTNIRIVARASKSGNADGAAHKYVEVVPPLSVDVTAPSAVLKSEASMNATVHVTYSTIPVEGAIVTLASDNGGDCTPAVGETDVDGWFQFTYKAPLTLAQMNVTLTATVTKTGYWSGSDQIKISIVPKTLAVGITVDPSTINSKEKTNLIIHVSSDGEPMADTMVTLSSDINGEFSATAGITDENGDLNATFTTPDIGSTIDGTITATANKSGYVIGQSQAWITVNGAQGGGISQLFNLSLTTLLLIIIPVVVVVIVVILIKKRIIVFSRSGEENQ